jgi:hypothetical protein
MIIGNPPQPEPEEKLGEFYVSPSAQIFDKSQIRSDEAVDYYGPYMNLDTAQGVAGRIQHGEIPPIPAKMAASTVQHASAVERVRTGKAMTYHVAVLLGLGVGGLVLLVCIIVLSATSARSALCNSGLGQLVQAGSTHTAVDCTLISGLNEMATVFAWLSGAWVALMLLGLFGHFAGANKDVGRS